MNGDTIDKTSLRQIARDRRRAFVSTLDPLAHRLAFKVLPSPLARRIADAQVVALYMGLDDEAPAQRLAQQLIAMGKTGGRGVNHQIHCRSPRRSAHQPSPRPVGKPGDRTEPGTKTCRCSVGGVFAEDAHCCGQ